MSDSRNMKVTRPTDQEHINTVRFFEFLKLSYIRWPATVESTDVFNRIAPKGILQTIGDRTPFEFQYFGSVEDACSWLRVDPETLFEQP